MKIDRIKPILTKLRRIAPTKRILVIGDVILDQYVDAKNLKKADGGAWDIVLSYDNPKFAGGAGNVATNIVGLTAQATLIGIVGKDADAKELKTILATAGVRCKLIQHHGWKIPKKVRLTVDGTKVCRVDTEAKQACDSALENKLLKLIWKSLPTHDVVVISDYHKGTFSKRTLEQISTECQRRHKLLILAPKPKPDGPPQSGYKGAYLMAINLLEAVELSGAASIEPESISYDSEKIESDSRLINLINIVDHKYSPQNLMMTLSKRGVLFRINNGSKKNIYHVLPRKCEKKEDTGAGDTMIAAYAVGLAVFEKAIDQRDLALLGNFAASYAVEQKHTTIVRLAELFRVVELLKKNKKNPF